MLKIADDYAGEIMDAVLEKELVSTQERAEVRDRVRRRIVESWRQERDQMRKKIKAGLEGLPRIKQDGVELIKLDEAELVVDRTQG
jgi:hypothetical protein